MARPPTIRERQKIITTVIAMWFQLMQEYMGLLSKLAVAHAMIQNSRRADPMQLTLPLPREVYRIGFLYYATQTTNQMCVNICRMRKRTFWTLVRLLKDEGWLVETYNMAAHEMLAIFLVTVGHNIKNRKAQFLFQRSAETISRTFKLVLLAILKLSPLLLEKAEPVPANCTDHRWKYFKGCLGALDGTMVIVRPTVATQTKYRNRKGQTAINVLGVCNTRMQFVYCLAGWPGSAHDSRILRDAMARDSSFRIPPGTYYLCDAGYTNARGFLTPYRGQRYHLTEWGRNRPRTKEELYNKRHSKARNVIECAFGVLKMRFSLLRDSSWFSPTRVGMIVNACVLLHNYIRREGGPDVFDSAYTPIPSTDSNMTTDEDVISSVEASDEWTQFRNSLAESMWAARGGDRN